MGRCSSRNESSQESKGKAAQQASGADERAMELHPLKSSAFPRGTVTPTDCKGADSAQSKP